MRTRTAALLAAALVTSVVAAPRAHADASRAWAAAKANLPSDSAVVVGLNFASIRKSQIFAKLYPALIGQKPDVQAAFDLAKSVCKIDPVQAIDGAVVGTDADQKGGVVYLALHDVDETKLISCFEAVAKSKGSTDTKVDLKHDGNVSELSSASSTDKPIYIGWIGKDVVVVSFNINDKASLQKWLGGKGGLAKSAVAKPIGKVNTNASAWLSILQDKELDPGVHTKAGYGSIDIASGNVNADIRVQLDSAASAAKEAASMTKQVGDFVSSGMVPPAIQPLLKGMKIAASGDEMTLKSSATEASVLAVVQMFLQMAGAGGGATP